MIVIHYSIAFKALRKFIDQFNARQKSLSQQLRSGTVSTAQELIRIYGIALLTGDHQEKAGHELPALRTNNQQLAKLVKCSARSIQRYILRLQEAGIITGKIFHGTRANYELFINPKILLINPRLPVENTDQPMKKRPERPLQNALQAQDSIHKATNWPLSYTSNTGKQNNNILIAVDKSKRLPLQKPFLMSQKAGNMTGNAGEIVLKKNNKAPEKNIPRAGLPVGPDVEQDPAWVSLLVEYSGLLWDMARKLLYHNVALTQRQVDIARRLIYSYYESVPAEQLSEVHRQYVARIALVDKYLQKDPRRFVTLPYLYFDRANSKGFAGTQKWYEASLIKKEAGRGKLTG